MEYIQEVGKQMTSKLSVDIEKAIILANNKTTTVEQLCKFIYNDIQDYQHERESFHVEEFKDQIQNCDPSTHKHPDDYTEIILKKIESDVRTFCVKYATKSIDDVLDAINQKKFRTKKGPENLLVLLSTLKEMYE